MPMIMQRHAWCVVSVLFQSFLLMCMLYSLHQHCFIDIIRGMLIACCATGGGVLVTLCSTKLSVLVAHECLLAQDIESRRRSKQWPFISTAPIAHRHSQLQATMNTHFQRLQLTSGERQSALRTARIKERSFQRLLVNLSATLAIACKCHLRSSQ